MLPSISTPGDHFGDQIVRWMFAIFADWGTKPTISQLKDFNREIGMDTPAEFRKHAADCEKMAKVSNDPETKAAWKRMAERWLLCAKLADDQDLFQRRRVEEKSSKPQRRPLHGWAAASSRL